MITIDAHNALVELILALTTNGIGMFILGILIVYALRTFSIRNTDYRYLYLLLGLSFIEMADHLVTTVLQYYDFLGSNTLGRILYSMVFVLQNMYLLGWILYIQAHFVRINKKTRLVRKKVILSSIPVFILLALSFINMVYPVFCSFIDFKYERHPAYYLTLLVPVVYMVVGIVFWALSGRRRRIYQQLPFVYLLMPIVIAHLLEWHFYRLCIVPLGDMIALIILILVNVKEYASVDGMTGLYTRRELYHYLDNIHDRNINVSLTGIMLDLNHFKQINDTYGHMTGDDALSDFGHLLRTHLPAGAIGYRYAGDEFVVLMQGTDEKKAEAFISDFKEKLAAFNQRKDNVYTLESSYGTAVWHKGDIANTFLERMDESMYKDKQKHM